jgi:membrane associated rhomboid family serine protease
MSSPHTVSPVNPIPPVVLLLVGAMALAEALFQLGTRGFVGGPAAVGWRLSALQDHAFSGEVFRWMLANGRWPGEQLTRFVTYPFLHASFTHALFVIVFLLALGKMVAEVFHWLAVLAVFFGAALAGALAYGLILDTPRLLIGGFPPVYGMIGAFTFLLWTRLAAAGEPQARAFLLIAVLMGAQLIFSLFFGTGNEWVADLAGFAAGFGLSFVVSPGGWARAMERLRRR